ncbi:hypothetical protein DMN91_001207 [Ooceraea biroi]|uniref:RRM domain-containing protein n=1 Tax=Ooceraea biroi TaxID=2015173 RepID=A0A026VT49_OOCBI|nr:31 kDa ribonucleoprotein, chloroplastic [Ooceraea biroi]EZA46958.1 hypothetical protein X777_00550 [Ooceraea biroi]RLU27403.1 hypothetical protein DMN91_001207 [Ooceraea biroi]
MASNAFRKLTLHIANIPWTVGRHELALYFSQFGYVHEASVAFNKQTGLHQGHGHVTLVRVGPKDVLGHKHFLKGKELLLTRKQSDDNDNGSTFN